MKYFLIILVLLILTGCGTVSRMFAGWNGYSEICIDGVSYLQFTSGVSVKYNSVTGHIQQCEK